MTKRFDEQIREMRNVLGYLLGRLGVKSIPEYLKEESS